jgi:tetratricopeptide (TPR) repeat protein
MASTTLRDYLQYTEDAISAGRIDDGLVQCQRILSHFPESLEAQRLLGEVYLAQEQLEDAQQAFDWILTNDPENIVVYCDRALICERMSDYDTALDCYQQAYELSRGNSQIRHEFNKLSAKVGQQGFMLSRAGLARLYMRGDLLSQAIQEWETILAANPDRLDARTGLLETYWREGLFEQVEEIATAILNDVPGCLKALLLLAHVTSLKDMQRAEELIQRAEMLDPELVMAQELFSDLIANQPHDPFLQLLKQEPVVLPEHAASLSTPVVVAPGQSTPATTNGSHESSSTRSDSLFSWSSLDTLIDTQQPDQPEQDIPTFAWSSNSALDINPWSTIDQLAGKPPVTQSEPDAKTALEPEPETDLEAGNYAEPFSAQESEVVEQPGWQQEDQFAKPVADTFDAWSSMGNMSKSDATPGGSTWGTEAREESDIPSPPAWLDMLTKGGRPQSQSGPLRASENLPEIPTSESEPEPVSPGSMPSTPFFTEQPAITRMPWEDELQMAPATASDEDEAFSFGPEWLKSLGAEVMESYTSSTPAPVEPAASADKERQTAASTPTNESDFWQEPSVDPWSSQATRSTQQEAPVDPWMEQLSASQAAWQTPIDPWIEQSVQRAQPTPPAQPPLEAQQSPIDAWAQAAPVPAQQEEEPGIPTAEQQYATLETLERDLFAQGFVPLEPGSLSTIAQEETLSSALAQFGEANPQPLPVPMNEVQPAQPMQQVPVPPAQTAQPEPQPPVSVPQSEITFSEPTEEPLWLATPSPSLSTSASPASNPLQEPLPHVDIQPQQLPEQPKVVPQPVTSATPVDPKAQAAQTVPTIPKKPAASNDFTLDELEMTMRRPVVKLQPTAQKPAASQAQGQPAPVSRSRPGAASRAGESNLSYKERLLKGYHHQLAGDYDEAMQEYRVIIRNAPELLGEVVSNMRALLKLAPRYAPGYRVLGDAYMRQGEYLQAMEAYNKALTMAKKGQAQGQR